MLVRCSLGCQAVQSQGIILLLPFPLFILPVLLLVLFFFFFSPPWFLLSLVFLVSNLKPRQCSWQISKIGNQCQVRNLRSSNRNRVNTQRGFHGIAESDYPRAVKTDLKLKRPWYLETWGLQAKPLLRSRGLGRETERAAQAFAVESRQRFIWLEYTSQARAVIGADLDLADRLDRLYSKNIAGTKTVLPSS